MYAVQDVIKCGNTLFKITYRYSSRDDLIIL